MSAAIRIVATVLLLCSIAACARGRPERLPAMTLTTGNKIGEGKIEVMKIGGDRTLMVRYRTSLSAVSCPIQAEVARLWSEYIESEANRRGVNYATVVPENDTYTSSSFSFRRNNDGTWAATNIGKCP